MRGHSIFIYFEEKKYRCNKWYGIIRIIDVIYYMTWWEEIWNIWKVISVDIREKIN